MFISRRQALLGAATLTACSPGSVSGLDQALADTRGALAALSGIEPILAVSFPKVVTPAIDAEVRKYLSLANAALAGLTAQSPVAITNLDTALADINLVLQDISSIAGMAASSDPKIAQTASIVEAVIALVPEAEALVKTAMAAASPGTAGAARRPLLQLRTAVQPRPTPDQARILLNVRKTP